MIFLITNTAPYPTNKVYYQDERLVSDHIKQVRSRQLIPFLGLGINPANSSLGNWDGAFFEGHSVSYPTRRKTSPFMGRI